MTDTPIYPHLQVQDDERDIEDAVALIGPDAKPSGRLRFLTDIVSGRLQQEWRGEYGRIWLDVPMIQLKHTFQNHTHVTETLK